MATHAPRYQPMHRLGLRDAKGIWYDAAYAAAVGGWWSGGPIHFGSVIGWPEESAIVYEETPFQQGRDARRIANETRALAAQSSALHGPFRSTVGVRPELVATWGYEFSEPYQLEVAGFQPRWVKTLPREVSDAALRPWLEAGYVERDHPRNDPAWLAKIARYAEKVGRAPVWYYAVHEPGKILWRQSVVVDLGLPEYRAWALPKVARGIAHGHAHAVLLSVKHALWESIDGARPVDPEVAGGARPLQPTPFAPGEFAAAARAWVRALVDDGVSVYAQTASWGGSHPMWAWADPGGPDDVTHLISAEYRHIPLSDYPTL